MTWCFCMKSFVKFWLGDKIDFSSLFRFREKLKEILHILLDKCIQCQGRKLCQNHICLFIYIFFFLKKLVFVYFKQDFDEQWSKQEVTKIVFFVVLTEKSFVCTCKGGNSVKRNFATLANSVVNWKKDLLLWCQFFPLG